jgi:hypothetical protein
MRIVYNRIPYHDRTRVLLEAVEREGQSTGRLWIVEQDRIREYDPNQ